jgi:hypothetical protein
MAVAAANERDVGVRRKCPADVREPDGVEEPRAATVVAVEAAFAQARELGRSRRNPNRVVPCGTYTVFLPRSRRSRYLGR